MKKLTSLWCTLIAVALILTFPLHLTVKAETTSGTTGDCTWTLDGTVLTISGNGAMGGTPWSTGPWGTEITSVKIEEGVTEVCYFAFTGCDKLTSVTLPKSVTSIGSYAFSGCKKLKSINIPKGVTSIGQWAFSSCESLTEVVIPYGVEEICYRSFASCSNLKSLVIPDSVTAIGARAFSDCSSLNTIIIPDSVTSIGNFAFWNCSKIESINLSKNIQSIGDNAFYGCTNLKSIVVNSANSKYSSQNGALYDKEKKKLLCCPNGKETYSAPNSVTSIGYAAFSGCKSLKTITLPKSITTIGSYAFSECAKITSIAIPNAVTTIDGAAFHSCIALNSITIPNNVITIGEGAFYSCTSLKSITIPNSVTDITYRAFSGCTNLASISMPNTVKEIKSEAFESCSSLKDVFYQGTEAEKALVSIDGWDNDYLLNATWHYNSCIQSADHTYDGACDNSCNVCGKKRTVSGHQYTKVVTTKASLTRNGVIKNRCKVCGYTSSKTTSLPMIKSVKLSTTAYTYNGSAKTPAVTVKDSAGKTLKKNTDYTVTYATGRIKAGTYKVTVKMKGNYSGTKTLSFKINPVKVSKCTTKLAATAYTYNGKVKTPAVTVKYAGKTLKKNTDYTVTYASGRIKAGTYKVTVKMKGNYSGTKTLSFKINPVKVTKCTTKLAGTSYVYNGKIKTPAVTVKYAGKTLKKNTDYTVTYAKGRKNVGTYKVTIKMKGNYSGTKTLTFKIVPKAASVKSLTAKSKALTVKLNRQTAQSTGYQIQYATNKSFKSAKTKNITSYKTSTSTIKSLKKKTTYYVRVRTYKKVGKTTYYSAWSTMKYKKTK